jgi:hypothetical protein
MARIKHATRLSDRERHSVVGLLNAMATALDEDRLDQGARGFVCGYLISVLDSAAAHLCHGHSADQLDALADHLHAHAARVAAGACPRCGHAGDGR